PSSPTSRAAPGIRCPVSRSARSRNPRSSRSAAGSRLPIAYLDCFSGISGDMLLGALLDAGVTVDALNAELDKLGIEGWSLHAERVMRGAVSATRAHVDLAESPQPHRRLPDILALLEASTLDRRDVERSQSVFTRLAQAEARVHGIAADDIEFHEVGALDAIVDVVGGVVGL